MLSKKISIKQVENYLKNNTDFFLNNPDLLDLMQFPSFSDNKYPQRNNQVISFKDWLIKNLKDKQKNIIENAKHNYFTQKKVHEAVINLILKENKQLVQFIKNELPGYFDLAVINIITSRKDISDELGLICVTEEMISKVYKEDDFLTLDAVDDSLGFFNKIDKKIYSNAIFSLEKKIFKSESLLIYASEDRQFLSNRAFDLILFLSKIIEQKLKEFNSEK